MFSFFQRRLDKQNWRSVRWFAIDCETDGLDANQNALLSLAWVPVEPPFVRLGAAEYAIIQHQAPLSQSAVVHQLTTAELQQGEPLSLVLQRFAAATKDGYLIAHYARFDRELLNMHMRREGILWQPQGWYDTLAVEKKQSVAKNQQQQSNLSLLESRSRYGLPAFKQHHALHDAIACGELFLAQNYSVQSARHATLQQVLRRGR